MNAGAGRGDGSKVATLVALCLLLSSQPAIAVAYPIIIPFGRSWPISIIVDSERGAAYFDATSGDYPPTGFLLGVINVTDHQVVRVLPLPVLPGPLALDARTGDLYVAGNDSIVVFPAGNLSAPRELLVGMPVVYIAHEGSVSDDVFFSSGDRVYAVDPSSGRVVGSASVPYGAGSIAIDPGTGRLFISEYLSGEIAVFHASNLSSMGSITLGSCCASDLALNQETHVLYAATRSGYVYMIDALKDAFVKSVKVADAGNSTNEIVADGATGRVFVSSSPGGSILELDQGGTVVGRFTVASQVAGLAIDASTQELFATNYHQITVFDAARTRSLPLLLIGAVAVAVAAVALSLLFRRRDAVERRRVQEGSQPGDGQD